ncbi:MAG TPA: GerMN domain-containing protein [Terriglobales bacterium]|nr:GerMN domain-containing protein [Terriglobales bacterium]
MIPRHLIIGVALMLAAALGMSLYVWHMRSTATYSTPAAVDARPVPAPVSGPSEQVTLWVAYDVPGNVRPQGARIPLPSGRQERAQELLRALIGLYLKKDSSHPLGAGSEIREVYLVDPGLAVIDTNAAFADGHRSGVLVEELTVASVVQTLASNIPGINRVRILVDGKTRDSLAGHADLSVSYDVGQVNQVVQQMQGP